MTKKPSLAETHPELAKQWHLVKNGNLTPYDVTRGSSKKVWWKCPKGDDHEWEYRISDRAKGDGCPICSGRKIVNSNSLAVLNPQLAKQWHHTKNGKLTPFDVGRSSGKKGWWQCNKAPDHEWISTINNRKEGKKGCPICSGRKIVLSNCLMTTHKNLSLQWHPKKNKLKTPYDVGKGHTQKVWWKCPKGDDHEWEASPNTRVNGNNCPICSGRKLVKSNSLSSLYPKLASEWHLTKNGDLKPTQIISGYTKKVWWKCPKGDDHEWEVSPSSRTGKVRTNCPICEGLKVVASNCLATTNPKLASEWHPTKNGDITPFTVVEGSEKKVWWKCPKGEDHVWKANINSRNRGNGCPVCSGHKVVKSNSLSNLDPKLASEWHPTKNGSLTSNQVTLNSNKVVWWKCRRNESHEWKVSINNRSNNKLGCPFCSLTPQSRQELIITFELLKFFKDINPKGYKTRLNGKLRAIDIFIPELNLAIEFDGSYWHKDKRAIDKIKSEMLMEKGFQAIRIREEPLKKIHENDIISTKPYSGKDLTNKILKKILDLFSLSNSVERKIHNYISKDSLQNEKALDKYIDQILEKKAAKKK